jgi:class 3 adenylate cyclase/tetratricopeptide (TPR) repeat protein/energy-coupling factor transporter ATP-binding protein EcfA2
MKCPKCQFDNLKGAKFCNECGNKLELACPECGKVNPFGSKFCNQCGYDLRKPKETTPVDYDQPQSYTPKFLADKILTTRSSIEGERKLVTVLFADVANYTSISEKLDPEEVHQIMDGCFKILMNEIHRYEGTINQFTGDGVMALFGAPLALEDHAQRACYAALAIQKDLIKYSEKLHNERGIGFKIRIGLNSGSVIVGSIGDDLRMDYTAVGDTTNLASRMESMAGPDTILVSTSTHRLARDFFEFKLLGKVDIKGKTVPQEAFEVIKASEVATRIEAASVKGLTRFVGRKNSLAAMMEEYEKAKAGSGQVVGIVGEAGVGKSRLLVEIKNVLPKDEYTYLEGRCLHYGDSMPYLPILDILRSYFAIKEGDREFVIKKKMEEKILHLDENLRGALPAFQDLLSLKVEYDEYLKLEPKQRKEKAFEAIRDLFIRESQNKMFFVAIDDVQWIDKTSEEFLNYLIDWLANAKALLILLYRPEYTHQWGSKSYYNHIGLNQLTMKSSDELIHAILEGGEVVPELSELILNRTSGNPLYMEELTHTLLENGSIERKDGQYVLSQKAADIEVPDTIQGIIAARMDRLEENLKRTMQMASVIGREFAFRILQTITGMSEELKSYLLNLQRLEFIYEKSLFPELSYIFKHALTQEVAYNSLLLKRRKEIHERIGEAIERIYAERLEEFYEMLAYRYARSGNVDKAYYYLKLSGDKARAGHANWEAFRFYREAIDVLGRMPSTDSNKREGIQVRLSLAMPAMFLSYPEDSINVLKVGMELAREVGDARSLAKLDGTLAHAYAIKGESILAIEHAEKCFQEAQEIQDLDLMAPVARDLTSAYMFAGEFLKAVPIFSTVIPLIEKADKRSESFGRPASVYTFLCGLAGFIMGLFGSMNEAEDLCEKACVNAFQNNDLYELAYAEFSFGVAAMAKGDGRSIVEHSKKCVDYLEQGQMATLMDPALATLGWGYVHQGDLKKAREVAERALMATSQPGAASGNVLPTQSILAMIYSELGDLEKAHSCATEACKLSKQRMVGGWEGLTCLVLGLVLARMEEQRGKEAEECIGRALMIFDEYRLRPWFANGTFTLGEFYMRSGHRDKGLEYLKKAEEMFKEMGMDYWLARIYALYAELFKRKGDKSKAKETLNKAIEILKECSAYGWVQRYDEEMATL